MLRDGIGVHITSFTCGWNIQENNDNYYRRLADDGCQAFWRITSPLTLLNFTSTLSLSPEQLPDLVENHLGLEDVDT
jgi:hypothetical protein